jgi:predicted TIM-barrel fold metal-dependent hydrolase
MSRTPVVDAHQHFWDPTTADYPWMTDEVAVLRRRFAPEDLLAELRRSRVDATILVEARSSFEESRELLALAAATDFVAGVVAWVDLTDEAVVDAIEELQAGLNGDLLVGIRHQVHGEPDPNWLLRDDVQRGLRAVGGAGLVFDLLVAPRELPAGLEAARRNPDMRFVIDHIAQPEIAAGRIDEWAALLAPFAHLEHVACKLSGMVTRADWQTWTARDLAPCVEHVLAWFGDRRLLFGSDWPVCLLAASYDQVRRAAEVTLGDISAAGSERIFGGTAAEVYGLRL